MQSIYCTSITLHKISNSTFRVSCMCLFFKDQLQQHVCLSEMESSYLSICTNTLSLRTTHLQTASCRSPDFCHGTNCNMLCLHKMLNCRSNLSALHVPTLGKSRTIILLAPEQKILMLTNTYTTLMVY